MAKIEYIPKRFSKPLLEMIEKCDTLMQAYARAGYRLTLRQLYYQFVSRGLFPDDRRWRWTGEKWVRDINGTKNATPNYKWLGGIVDGGRKAGLLDWEIMEDRARETVFLPHWSGPEEIMQAVISQFRIDKWENQPCHIEVMAEKDAVSGILEPICNQLQVRFTANRGYASSSLFHDIAQRISRMDEFGKEVHILYLGDHDPSGVDMSRDIEDRMGIFTFGDIDIKVTRLALNMDQILLWNPPEDPAKETDSRYKAYEKRYGDKSWELDAIEPAELSALVENFVIGLRDDDEWDAALEREQEMIERLKKSKNAL